MTTRADYGPPSGDGEAKDLLEVLNLTYLRTPEEGETWLRRSDPASLRVVRVNGRVAGGLRLLPDAQWFGGRAVPMTGIASVAVSPQDRGTGLATSMMRSALEEIHAAGTPLSALYPATQPVYRRTGWELAGTWARFRVPAASIDVRDRSLDVRRAGPEDRDTFAALYTRRARRHSGHLQRSDRAWESVLHARSTEEVHAYLVLRDGTPEGYAVFTQDRDKRWKYDLHCRDLVALTPDAARRLWSFFADHRSFANDVTWTGHEADPHLYVLREQDWEYSRGWTWMLRVVDVRGALSVRGYPPGLEAEVHLEVRDDVCGWNEGRFVLEVSGGEGRVRKGGRGKVALDVRGLASLYTGFATAQALSAAGYAQGREPDLALASATFGGPAPWLPDFF